MIIMFKEFKSKKNRIRYRLMLRTRLILNNNRIREQQKRSNPLQFRDTIRNNNTTIITINNANNKINTIITRGPCRLLNMRRTPSQKLEMKSIMISLSNFNLNQLQMKRSVWKINCRLFNVPKEFMIKIIVGSIRSKWFRVEKKL